MAKKTKPKMTVIDGSDKSRAPAPKWGVTLAAYEVLRGLGASSEAQIYKYLPTVVDNPNMVTTHKKLTRALENGVRRGYFITLPDGRYRIAPLSYYKARKQYYKELAASGPATAHRVPPQIILQHGLHTRFMLVAAFVAGLVIGVMLTVAVFLGAAS